MKGSSKKSASLSSLGLDQTGLKNSSKRARFNLWLVWQKFRLEREDRRRQREEQLLSEQLAAAVQLMKKEDMEAAACQQN